MSVPLMVEGTMASRISDSGAFMGEYDSLREMEEDVLHLSLAFVGSYDKFVRRSVWWEVDGEVVDSVPYAQLMPRGSSLTMASMGLAAKTQQGYELELTRLASRAYDLITIYAEEYSKGGYNLVRAEEPVMQAIDAPEDQPLYSCFTVIPLGAEWKCVVDFRSTAYPELQGVLEELRSLRHERDSAVREALR